MRTKLFTSKRKKISSALVLFLFLLTFFTVGKTSARAQVLDQNEQLLDLLKEQRRYGATRVDFSCGNRFYTLLRDNDFLLLYHLLVKAGIDYSQVLISYSDITGYISLSGLDYVDFPWAECMTIDEVRMAVNRLAGNQEGFILLCSRDLAEKLTEDNTLRAAMTQNGAETFYTTVSTEVGIIKISGVRYFPVPFVFVEDQLQFSSAIAYFFEKNVRDFYIIFEPEFFSRIYGDSGQYTVMIGSSKLANYWSSTDPDSYAIHFSSVEYTEAPREIIREISDVPEAIRRMGAAGVSSFELIFPDAAVFDALYKNDFALLYSLEAEAGMSSGSISYSSARDRIVFSEAVITADAVRMSTLSEVIGYTKAQIESGRSDIHLFCTPELFDALLGNYPDQGTINSKLVRIYDLTVLNGIFDYDISFSDVTHVINIHVKRLYPGTAILQAVRTGDTSSLSLRELETLNAVSKIVPQFRDPDPLSAARSIHDWICAHVVYTDDPLTNEDDNAIGAILNGKANCDGYSDAFFLMGNLAGLNVRYQHGDSYQRTIEQPEASVTHMWNLLNIRGSWYMVDVTWDDDAYGWSHTWFVVGRDIADRMHFWNRDMTVPLAENTERFIDFDNEFFVAGESDLREAVNTAARNRVPNFYILFSDRSLKNLRDTGIRLVSERCGGSRVLYSWNDKMLLLSFYDIIWK